MKRLVLALTAAYVAVAVATRLSETAGRRHCGCADDCWCHRRGLTLFRWVWPRGHRARRLG